MKLVKATLAALMLLGPMLVMESPAQALTARQYHAQGHGRYISSKGRMHRYGMRHHYRHHHRMHRY
jgi:hypothetical protein